MTGIYSANTNELDFTKTNQLIEQLMRFQSGSGESVERQALNSFTPNAMADSGVRSQLTPVKALSMEGAFGGANNAGWLTGGAQAASSLLGGWNGLQQYKLGKKAFDFQVKATNRDLANQAKNTNSFLMDRQNARISAAGSGGDKLLSAEEYVTKYGVDGSNL